MSRQRWRVSRALRVLLACLALWLPAKSAMASVAPADAVVMMARAAGTGAEVRAARIDEKREVRRVATDAHRASRDAALFHAREPLFFRPKAVLSRAVTLPLYLLYCALLR